MMNRLKRMKCLSQRVMNFKKITKTASILTLGVLLASCRGQLSEKPPVHLNQNMDDQERMEAQEENSFFEDNRSMRDPVEGTVAMGYLKDDPTIHAGTDEDGEFVEEIPYDVTRTFLKQGQQQYEVFCTPCHGSTGDGEGIIMRDEYGYVPAPSFHDDRIRELPEGEIYAAITEGVRTMPSYAHQVDVEDRWAITGYIRALQRSQNVPEEDLEQYDVDIASLQDEFAAAQQEEEDDQSEQEESSGEGEVSAEQGEQLLSSNGCNACHTSDGSESIGPTFQDLFGSERQFEDGSEAPADEEYIHESIVDPQAKIVEGYDPVMMSYEQLSDDEIDSIIEFFKTISDN